MADELTAFERSYRTLKYDVGRGGNEWPVHRPLMLGVGGGKETRK